MAKIHKIQMSKIDAETLGDAAVAEARENLAKVIGTKPGEGIKKIINDIKTEVDKAPDGDGIAQATVKASIGEIQTALGNIKSNPTYEDLSDTVKAEITALETVVTDLATAADSLNSTPANNKTGKAVEAFKSAYEEVVKVETSLSDLNAAQTADLAEMRDKLTSFVASPEGAATKLDSTNFTAFIDTLDTALSKISDQRAKLGAR